MRVKIFGERDYDLRSLPAAYTGIEHRIITGDPDPERTSTSYLERNLTVRIGMRNSHALPTPTQGRWKTRRRGFRFTSCSTTSPAPYDPLQAAGRRKRITPAIAAGGGGSHLVPVGDRSTARRSSANEAGPACERRSGLRDTRTPVSRT
jgi:hypothetical protein